MKLLTKFWQFVFEVDFDWFCKFSFRFWMVVEQLFESHKPDLLTVPGPNWLGIDFLIQPIRSIWRKNLLHVGPSSPWDSVWTLLVYVHLILHFIIYVVINSLQRFSKLLLRLRRSLVLVRRGLLSDMFFDNLWKLPGMFGQFKLLSSFGIQVWSLSEFNFRIFVGLNLHVVLFTLKY